MLEQRGSRIRRFCVRTTKIHGKRATTTTTSPCQQQAKRIYRLGLPRTDNVKHFARFMANNLTQILTGMQPVNQNKILWKMVSSIVTPVSVRRVEKATIVGVLTQNLRILDPRCSNIAIAQPEKPSTILMSPFLKQKVSFCQTTLSC